MELENQFEDFNVLIEKNKTLLQEIIVLQDEAQLIKNENLSLKDETLTLKNEILSLQDLINLLTRKKYAPHSEKVSSGQLGLFNEVEALVNDLITQDGGGQDGEESDGSEEKETIVSERKKKRNPRIPEHLPRVDTIIDLREEEKFCSFDGTPLKEIGVDISEKLEIIPAKITVARTIRKKYACPCCQDGVKTPAVVPSILPKTMASESLLSNIIIAKFADALPLYRQEAIFLRIGIELSRQTMARWLVSVAEKLMPLYNLLQDRLLERKYIQMDETTTQVLNEEGKKATSKSYMWVRHAPGENPIILFDYAPTRSGDVPVELLNGFQGRLQVDGYDGYAKVCAKKEIIRIGCMDHCRRYFYDAFKSSNGKGVGKKALVYLKKLYELEEKHKKYSPEDKFLMRQTKAKPIMEDMHRWIIDQRFITSPKSISGKAINYAFNEWKYLIGYLEDGNLHISNALVENKIRPFAVGRKNWLFSASVEGAKASAMFFSLIETAKANGINSYDYFNKILGLIPFAKTVEDFENLLPLKEIFNSLDTPNSKS